MPESLSIARSITRRNLRRASWPDLAAALLIAVVVVTLWLRLEPTVDGVGWIGWDAYPILLASQVDSARDVFDVATRRLAGEHLKADFYRPLLMLTVSAEQSFLAASPATSLAIQVLLFGACLSALWWWIGGWRDDRSRAVGRDPRSAGLVTLVLVSMHPAVFDVVPYLPRRAELLCLLFVLLTLRLDRLWVTSGRRTALVLAILCAALAMASKETAILLPLLVVASRWLHEDDPLGSLRDRRRLKPHLKARLAPLATYGMAVGIVLLPRLAVLGGAGGYPDADRSLPFSPKLVAATLIQLFAPESGLVDRTAGCVAMALLAVGCLAALWPLRESVGRHRLVWFSALWTLLAALLFAVVGRVSPWYLLFVGCGAFLGVGALTVEAWRDSKRGWTWKHWGNLWLGGLALLVFTWWPGSLFGGSTDDLHGAGRAVASCLEGTARRCEGAPLGEPVLVTGCPAQVAGHGRSVAVTKPRSVAAWAAWGRPDCMINWPTPETPNQTSFESDP